MVMKVYKVVFGGGAFTECMRIKNIGDVEHEKKHSFICCTKELC